MLVDRFTHNILHVVASTGRLNVAGKGPLANTPVLYLTLVVVVIISTVIILLITSPSITWHHIGTPIVLSRHLTEILLRSGAGQVDADVMRAVVVVLIDAVSRAGVAREGHPLGTARLELIAVNVVVAVDDSAGGAGEKGTCCK